MEDKEMEYLYNHYVETCSLTRDAEQKRTRYLIFSILSLFFFSTLSLKPDDMFKWIQGVVISRSGAGLPLSLSLSKVLFFVLFLYFQVSYYQKCVFIERQYLYSGELECKIGITREGKAYNERQPVILLLIGWFYKYVLPIIISLVLIYSIRQNNDGFYFLLFYCGGFSYYSLLTILYLKFQKDTERKYDTNKTSSES